MDALRSRLGYDVASMRASGYDSSIVEEHQAFNETLESFLAHPVVGEYLRDLTPREVYVASGVRVLPLDAIREEIQQLAPGARIFRHGYLPFATSIGGNAVCFDIIASRVVWADHGSFGVNAITYRDQSSGEYRTVPFTPENIAQAVVPLAEDIEALLVDLLDDKLEKILDALD